MQAKKEHQHASYVSCTWHTQQSMIEDGGCGMIQTSLLEFFFINVKDQLCDLYVEIVMP